MKIAVVNALGVVVDVIVGQLSDDNRQPFTDHFSVAYGPVSLVSVDKDTGVWIEGSYTDGVFTTPPEPEPEPEVPSDPLPS